MVYWYLVKAFSKYRQMEQEEGTREKDRPRETESRLSLSLSLSLSSLRYSGRETRFYASHRNVRTTLEFPFAA